VDNRARLREFVKRIIDSGVLETKTVERYRARLWAAAERLFNGGRDAAFMATFIRSIDQQLTQAWMEGAASVNVQQDEMTPDDFGILEAIINNETEFINGIADAIQSTKDEGITKEQFDKRFGSRVDTWANRYNETVNRARVQVASKKRFKWVLGKTEEHCDTCARLNGIIAFGYEWESAKVHPQMPPNEVLACGGWKCDCGLEPTDERRTPRALNRITNIVMAARL
jgi:hypothetical protein